MQGGGTRPPPLSLPASHTGGRQPAANRPPTRRASITIDSRLHEVLDADATVPSRGHDHSKNTRCSPPPVQARPGAPPRGARLSPRRGGGATVTVSRAVAPPVAAEVGIQGSLVRKQAPLRLLASRRQHPARRRWRWAPSAVDRGQGVDAISITDRVDGISFTVHPGLPGSRSFHISRPRLSNDANLL